jgi:hypothetical protein
MDGCVTPSPKWACTFVVMSCGGHCICTLAIDSSFALLWGGCVRMEQVLLAFTTGQQLNGMVCCSACVA